MSRAKSRNRRQQQYESYHQPYVPEVKPRTFHQAAYIKSIRNHQLTFGIGPAGCGKTWLCAALSAHALMEHGAEKIVITRPVVEAEERLGFLPGNAEDKFAPYFAPFREVLEEFLGKGHVSGLMKAGRIEIAPLAYMRGRTFKNAWVVLDEAQNVTLGQMKLFLTRIGENARVIVNGDLRQSDVQGASGLRDALARLRHVPDIGIVEFDRTDVVRSGLVRNIVDAYESDQPAPTGECPGQVCYTGLAGAPA